MIFYLPKNLAGLAKFTEREATRFALNNLHVRESHPDWYRIDATDGRRLVIAQGPNTAASEVERKKLGLQLGGTDEGERVLRDFYVPSEVWAETFRLVKKGETLAARAAGRHIQLSTAKAVSTAHLDQEVRFPNIDGLISDLIKTGPQPLRPGVLLKAEYLLQAFQLAADMEMRLEVVTFPPYGKGDNASDRAVGLKGTNEAGQMLDILIMPLS